MKIWMGCAAVATALCLASCDHDDDRYGHGYGYGHGGNKGTEEQWDADGDFCGQWKGKIGVSYDVYGYTFKSDEVYLLLEANSANTSIGTGELICFYDDKLSPIEWESFYLVWHEDAASGSVGIEVPYYPEYNCTLMNWAVKNGELSGVIKTETTSAVLSLKPLEGFDGWDQWNPETKYGAAYRNPDVKGQWTGSMGIYYTDKESGTDYDADHANVRFIPSSNNPLQGDGEDQEFYNKPCPIEWESFYIKWAMEDGMLDISYPHNPDLNISIYDIVVDGDELWYTYDSSDGKKSVCLRSLSNYNKWYLYDADKGYAFGAYPSEAPEAGPRKVRTLQSGHSSRRAPGVAPVSRGRHHIIKPNNNSQHKIKRL